MKNSLIDLKTVVTEYKKRIPKSNASKAELYKFATEKKLIEEEPKREIKKREIKQEKVKRESKKKDEEEPVLKQLMEEHEQQVDKEVKKVEKKVKKVEKEITEHKKESPKKHNKSSALSSVQAIRKERNISLKEAWEIYKQ